MKWNHRSIRRKRMLRGMKILLAEDNEINMEIAEFYLTELRGRGG